MTQKYRVRLRVYDLSNGLLKMFSPLLLFKKFDGMWHTGLEVYGYEYFYGGGIVKLRPIEFEHQFDMKPTKVISLGYTNIDQKTFERHLMDIRESFTHYYYDIAQWNCNHFTDYISKFLVGSGVPNDIVNLPDLVNETFIGRIVLSSLKKWNEDLESVPVGEDHPKRLMDSLGHKYEKKHKKHCHGTISPATEKASERRRVNRDRSEVLIEANMRSKDSPINRGTYLESPRGRGNHMDSPRIRGRIDVETIKWSKLDSRTGGGTCRNVSSLIKNSKKQSANFGI